VSNRDISRGAVGWISFAGFVMMIGGGFAILQGLALVVNSNQFPIEDSVIGQNANTWGWIHLVVGAVVLFSGLAVFSGNVLARTVGVIAASVSALGAFATIQFQPFWNFLIIFVDICIIWALTVHGRDVQRMNDEMGM
jgi:hypothetical protein